MKLNELIDPDDYEGIPEYTDSQIQDAFVSKEPVQALRSAFKDMWPKVSKWLRIRLRDVKVDKAVADNEIGGLLKAKLDTFLDSETEYFEDNALTLTRELLACIASWQNKKVKPKDIPQPMMSGM
jgi:hypothetical protein